MSINFTENACINLYFINVIKLQLLKKYKDYADMFSKKKTIKFLDLTRVKYAIFIVKDVEVLYKLIYKLSKNKL